ncbi:MAG: carbohydrate ABC transporter permease [Anaerolineae bacterium]|jgi:multiple sugar transport system permease protein
MSIPISKQRRWTPTNLRKLGRGLLFVSPWLIGFLAFTLVPLIASIYFSFHRYDLMRPPNYVGLANYVRMFTEDPRFLKSVYNTVFYVGLSAPLGVISAFLLANLLNTRIIGRSFFRALFFFPSIVPAVVTAMIWRFLLNVQYGAINATLVGLGLPRIPFLSNPDLAKPSLIMIFMWAQGNQMVIYLASLQDVPRSLYEAATMDGANTWHKFWNVTVPMCTPVILFNLIMSFIGGIQNFVLPWLLTDGGPNQATEFLAIHLYRNAFEWLHMGYASALAWVMFIAIVVLTVVLFKTSGRWVYYGGGEH